jgi:hypothetical protein
LLSAIATKAQGVVRKLSIILIFLVSAICCFGPAHNSSAAILPKTTQAPSGITVSPAFQQVQIKDGETQHLLEFSITNHRPTSETIQLSTADFNALSETGGLFFVGSNPTQIQKKYGLANWLNLPNSSVTVAPSQTIKISAYVLNDPTLTGGGHYGALMLALQSDNQSSSKNNKIALHPIASSLLFATKLGGDTHKLKLSNVYFSHNLFKQLSSVTLRFYNNGNTHLIPRGTVMLTSPGGKTISQGTINEDSSIILPEVYRQYTVPLNKVSSPVRPGNYKLNVNFRFDGYDQFRSYQANIFLITPAFILLILLVLGGIICAIYLYKKSFNKSYFSGLFHRRKNRR